METINKIYLTGYMGSGKSYIAKELTDSLNWSLLDLDQRIQIKMAMSINEIFEKYGESYFRKLEEEEIVKITATQDNNVISLGGGSYCQQSINDVINNDRTSFIVYLKYSAKVLTERLRNEKEHRPLIKNVVNLEEFINQQLLFRNNYYDKADLIIEGENDSTKIKNQILSYLRYCTQKLSTI